MLADVHVIDPVLLLFLNPIDLVNLLVAKIKLESKELYSIQEFSHKAHFIKGLINFH